MKVETSVDKTPSQKRNKCTHTHIYKLVIRRKVKCREKRNREKEKKSVVVEGVSLAEDFVYRPDNRLGVEGG